MTRIRDIANILSSSTNMATDAEVTSAISAQFVAGKNKIINGDFGVWQRGTSFSNPASAAFTSDRWSVVWDGSGATRTISQQSFTPGTAPVSGYEGRFFYRFNQSVAGTSGTYNLFQNRMEDVRTFAGQTVTISFWGKAAATTNLVKLNFEQEFGTGGSPSANVSTDLSTGTITLTTSWQRFSYTVTVPSISGKTVGTTTLGYLGLRFWVPVNSTFTIDIWGVQVEAGSTATNFTTATGTIQGELAACQRYYYRFGSDTAFQTYALGSAKSTTIATIYVQHPVQLRIVPSSLEHSGLTLFDGNSLTAAPGSIVINGGQTGKNGTVIEVNYSSAALVQFRPYQLLANSNSNSYMAFTAEL
jgi:hypothetical protein